MRMYADDVALIDRAQAAQRELAQRDGFEPPRIDMTAVMRRALRAECERVIARAESRA